MGKRVRIYPSADIFFPWNIELSDDVTIGWEVKLYSLGKITIGQGSMVSQHAFLCAGSHDIEESSLPLITPPVVVGKKVWICADAFIGPGVRIGDNSIVGARSALFKSIPEGIIVGGNPATLIRRRVFFDPSK